VVEADEGLVGMAQAEPARAYLDTVDIGMNMIAEGARSRGLGTAMLQSVLGWAGSRKYQYCTVGWTSSNLISDAFYRSRGFTPVRYRLRRRIDLFAAAPAGGEVVGRRAQEMRGSPDLSRQIAQSSMPATPIRRHADGCRTVVVVRVERVRVAGSAQGASGRPATLVR